LLNTEEKKEFNYSKSLVYQKLYYANAIVYLYFLIYEGITFSSYPGMITLLILKSLWGISILIYVFSNSGFPKGINTIGVILSLGLGFQIQVFAPESAGFNFHSFTYGTALIIFSVLSLTGMNILYSLLMVLYVKLVYFIILYKYAEFQYTYFSIYIFIFLGITIGSIINDFFQGESRLSKLINYWKDYSSQLVSENLPKEYILQNASTLYLDLTGLYNYYNSINGLKILKELLSLFYSNIELIEKKGKISKFDDSKGHFWFIVYENPRVSDYSDSIFLGQFALELKELLSNHCNENKLDFSFRMGMSSGSYIDYSHDTKNSTLKIFKSEDVFRIAKDMESQGINGEIQVSHSVYDNLKKEFIFSKRNYNGVDNEVINSYLLVKKKHF
jgi:hypothetical protein